MRADRYNQFVHAYEPLLRKVLAELRRRLPPDVDRAAAEAWIRRHRVRLLRQVEQRQVRATPTPAPSAVPKRAAPTKRPPLELLQAPVAVGAPATSAELGERVIAALEVHDVEATVHAVRVGPVVSAVELVPAAGTRVSRIAALADDVAITLGVDAVRVAAGRGFVSLEVPSEDRRVVALRDVLDTDAWRKSPAALPTAVGLDQRGLPVVIDLAELPHLLIAGTTGSGKSVAVNAMILGWLSRLQPTALRLVLVDPKRVEFGAFRGVPHVQHLITDVNEAVTVLDWAAAEMDRRYVGLERANARSLAEWRARDRSAPPYLVVVVDELADLMTSSGKRVERSVARLAQKARAAGIHLVLATQRPSVDVLTGTIKANIPGRLVFRLPSSTDSRTAIGMIGAEKLLGRGDGLLLEGGQVARRVHAPLVSADEIRRMTAWWSGAARRVA